MIKLKNVSKFYYSKGVIASGFVKVNLEFNLGEFIAITGESGSGKTTLLNVIGGLDTYEEGEMYINGSETSHYVTKDWEKYRREYIGNIYQNFNLINSYTVYQNVELVLTLNGVSKKERKAKVLKLLEEVDLVKFKRTKVSKLSGGQKQRVAIARALAKDTPIILADEPTGNLDKKSALSIIKLLSEIAKEKLVIIVTHNYEQVEEYVTRKITMHDGKVLEDKKIKDYKEVTNYEKASLNNIKLIDKIHLGIRNTFNIIPKFILLFLVYAFIVVSLMTEYSAFRKEEYEASKDGYNYIFSNTDDKRIVIKKKDKTPFSTEEISKLKKAKNIDYVLENDFLVDQYFNMANDNNSLWVSGNISSLEFFKDKVDVGRLPKEANEIVIKGSKDDYYLGTKFEDLFNNTFYLSDDTGRPDKSFSIKIVGIKYLDDSIYEDYTLYFSKEVLDRLLFQTHERYSNVTIDFMGHYHEMTDYDNDYKIVVNENVSKGEAYIPEFFRLSCPNNNCFNCTLNVSVKNIYFNSSKDLLMTKTYNKDNIDKVLHLDNYIKENFSNYDGMIYINKDDYNELFNKGTYQMSVFVDDYQNLESVVNYLEENNYKTISIKDTLVNSGTLQIIKILKTVITGVLIIVMFFISYFVIRIILKSRNIYFSIIRMLGGTKKTAKDLLITELFVVSNIAYFVFVIVAYLQRIDILHINFIDTVNRYFVFKDYIILYVVVILMSYLISLKYANKLFKNSAMNTYREEM